MNTTATATETDTDVAIIGAGPAGLMLAIELGCRGVRCTVFEEDDDVPVPPKANATSARTMEHYRRRGFADAVRAVGLTPDHPQDVVYATRLGGIELGRFAIPSRADAAAQQSFGDLGEAAWPTPELPHRGNQMFIEPILRAQARRWPSVDVHFGARVSAVRDDGDVVVVEAGGDAARRLRARFAVGCDGPRSLVRETMGVKFTGLAGEKRDFFGGQMLSLYFRSADLQRALGQRAWTTWLMNREQRGVLVAIDGVDHYVFGIQLKPGQQPADVDVPALFAAVCTRPFGFELIDRSPWTAGHMLVADRFSAGRLFIAGDAAHLFTPTGGMGYNTSVDDAVNLGWKLAAAVRGWGGPALLDSYEAERRPVAERNTAFARSMAESIGRMPVPDEVEAPDADAVRDSFGAQLLAHAQREFNIPGIQLGLRYDGPVVAAERGEPPPDEPTRYVPSGWPGARAPHLALADGRSVLDTFGRDFTLLAFDAADAQAWQEAATALNVPLAVVHWPDAATADAARTLYGADRVLVRPDHHIAWRGGAQADAADALALATGR